MENVIIDLNTGSSWLYLLRSLVDWLNFFGLPSGTFSVAIIFSSAGLSILNRFTGHVGYATLPLNYLALLFGSMFANWCLRDIKTPFDPTLQAPIIFSIAGMTVAGLFMMAVLRKE